jgi:iron complex transport system ATP-binding protein
MNAGPVYRVAELSFAYGKARVLQNLSTHIDASDFVAIVGPNGAGKSTFLKILAGLIRRYDGNVSFDGLPLSRIPARDLARRIAFVPQETHVVFPFTVSQMILMGRSPHRTTSLVDSPLDLERAERAMRLTDTLGLAKKAFNQLSGGERQRVVLGSALAQEPAVLLLDEPTVYLDLKHQIHFYDIVERLNSEQGMTVVSVTHDVNLAARYARRMIAMRGGKFVADGIPEAVLTPEHIHDIFEVSVAVLKGPNGRGTYIVPAD